MPEEIGKLTRSQLKKVFGDSGTERFSGYFTEEPNTVWRDSRRIDTVEEMRRTDASVKSVLNAIKAPIISSKWDVEGGDDRVREFVKENLFNMKRTWTDWLRESLTFLDFGHSVFELVFGVNKDGRIVLTDLSPRIQRSIESWKMSDGMPGIKQTIRTDEFENTYADIPMEKLLVLTNDKEGDDITGQSVLRAAYKHYRYKDVLYRIQGIAAERYGVGVPVFTMAEEYGQKDKDLAEEAMTNLRSNEKGYLVKKKDEEVTILTPGSNPQGAAITEAISHHNKMVQLAVLANFLSLGDDGVGSFALSTGKISFFLKHVDDKANYLAEQVTKQVICRLVHLNFGEVEEMPRLVHSSIIEADNKETAEVLSILDKAGLIQKTPEVVSMVHERFNLPDFDESAPMPVRQEAKPPNAKEEEPEEEKEEDESLSEAQKKKTFLAERPYKPFRKLTLQEERAELAKLNAEFNKIEGMLENGLVEEVQKAIDTLVKKSETVLKEDDARKIFDIRLGALLSVVSILNKTAKQAFAVGKKMAAKEVQTEEPKTSRESAQIRQAQIAGIREKFKQDLEAEAKEAVRTSIETKAAIAAALVAVRRRLNKKGAELVTAVTSTYVGENVNKGRREVFTKNLEKITHFQRSEVLDSRTCNVCLSLDKRIVTADDPFANLEIVHSFCRGTWVPIFGTDDQPEKKTVGVPKTIKDRFDTVDGRPSVNRFKQIKKATNTKDNPQAQDEIKKRLEKKK